MTTPADPLERHTVGPWQAVDDAILADDGCVVVAQALLHDGLNPTEWQANLRLIAAAPELLNACKAMVGALDETKYDVFIGSPSDLLRLTDGRAALLTAIANAEGRGQR